MKQALRPTEYYARQVDRLRATADTVRNTFASTGGIYEGYSDAADSIAALVEAHGNLAATLREVTEAFLTREDRLDRRRKALNEARNALRALEGR